MSKTPQAPQNSINLEISLTTAKVGNKAGVTYDIFGILDYIKIYEERI